MNRKRLNIIIILILLLFFYEIFDHANIINNTIINSSKIWFYNIIPSILPIYIIIDLFINYNIIYYLKILYNPIKKIFKINNNSAIIFILSILSGFPSNSKYINSMLENKTINLNDANKLLVFTHFSNPLFIINTIGNNFLHNKRIGFIILISHYLTNIILGLINRNYNINTNDTYNYNYKKKSFTITLTDSIYNTIKILFLLYGIITFFMIITSIINVNINLNPILKSIINGLLEMTGGIYYTSILNINIIYKAFLMTFFISFGGLSIHMQVFSILNKYKLNYVNYLTFRIIHAILSSSIVYIILKL